MTDGPELKPCPFCGGNMQVAMRDAMLCLECYAAGPQNEDRKVAWNTRADATPLSAALAHPAVRELVDFVEDLLSGRDRDDDWRVAARDALAKLTEGDSE